MGDQETCQLENSQPALFKIVGIKEGRKGERKEGREDGERPEGASREES